MRQSDWADAGQGWQGKETTLRLHGWGRQRRIILLRRKLAGDPATTDRTNPAQPLLGFPRVSQVWLAQRNAGHRDRARQGALEYAALVTSLDCEILTLGQLYRDRADAENVFNELKNQWGWGGFTTPDLTRCRLLAGTVALVYNWWSLFARLADPEHHREAITTKSLLLSAIARKTQHAGQVTLTISTACATRHDGLMCVSLASWLSCGKTRSSWTRWQGGIESSAKRCGTSCKDAGFSRQCASTRLERLPRVVSYPRSPAECLANCRPRVKSCVSPDGRIVQCRRS
jgi:hypothetical protein